jgi:hypothetical protein
VAGGLRAIFHPKILSSVYLLLSMESLWLLALSSMAYSEVDDGRQRFMREKTRFQYKFRSSFFSIIDFQLSVSL